MYKLLYSPNPDKRAPAASLNANHHPFSTEYCENNYLPQVPKPHQGVGTFSLLFFNEKCN